MVIVRPLDEEEDEVDEDDDDNDWLGAISIPGGPMSLEPLAVFELATPMDVEPLKTA